MRVLVVSDGSAPLVSVQAAWVDRADGLEPPADDAAPAIAALLDAGTRTRSRAAVADEARAIGGVIKGFAVAGTLGLRADFLPQHLARGLALVADCVARPAFAEREVDAVERGLPARLRDDARRAAEGERAALRLFRETLWPDAARRAEADAPPAMGRFALLDRYRRRYPLSRLIVAVVGNVDPAAVAAALTIRLPRARLGAGDRRTLSDPPLPAPRGEGKSEGARQGAGAGADHRVPRRSWHRIVRRRRLSDVRRRRREPPAGRAARRGSRRGGRAPRGRVRRRTHAGVSGERPRSGRRGSRLPRGHRDLSRGASRRRP